MPAGKSEQIISSVRFMALGILVLIAVVMLQLYQGGADGSGCNQVSSNERLNASYQFRWVGSLIGGRQTPLTEAS